ncbi:MAG: phosphoribosyl-AMP cyclohydrolase [Pseudomonadota bacterium]
MKANYYLGTIRRNERGLAPTIGQAHNGVQVLKLAWTSRKLLERTGDRTRDRTRDKGRAVYWSHSRKAHWQKGEPSGHRQIVRNINIDCDGDTRLLSGDQLSCIACHPDREHCLYRYLDGENWNAADPVLKDPASIYVSANLEGARRDRSDQSDRKAGDSND